MLAGPSLAMLPAMPLPLRTKLWPTQRRFEWRHRELLEELSALRARLDDLGRRQEQMLSGQAELRTRLRRTQALTARTYEALQGWPAQLAAARSEPTYEHAWGDDAPLISIPIPTYHSPDTLCDRALASVRAQSYQNWEAIVVGDHCTDETEERVRAIGDRRIHFHNLPVRENDPDDPWERWAIRGSVPRATGIDLAQGRWIAPLSHDDAWDPDHLSTLLGAARDTHAEFAYSRMRAVDAESPKAGSTHSVGAWPPRLGQYAFQASIFHGALRFLRYDRACALASEPNDWNLARRAWDAGVRFHFVDRETATLFVYPRRAAIETEYATLGLPPSAAASP
jgi:hypothetical protein